ncbi:MAG: outer membrane protein assembly factor BamE [Pseudomonadales bacterium]|nr:outer membrane protein assembly factor BamE [Pseudomonadales bacterium]
MTVPRITYLLGYCLIGSVALHVTHADEYVSKSEFEALEKRVELLEKAINTPTPPVSAPSPGSNSGNTTPGHWVMDSPDLRLENWQAIKSGMKPDQVKALLGSPSQIIKINWQNIWYYQTRRGNGSVIFNGTGTVSQVQIPPL